MTIDKIKKDIDTYVNKNSKKLHKEINVVIGVSRGGLIPATLIATKLDKPLLAAYINRKNEIFLDNTNWIRGKNILVVDDIKRSGRTLFLLDMHLKSINEPNSIKYLTVYSANNLVNEKYPIKTETIIEMNKDIDLPWDYPRIKNNNS